jgi:hypothetical protein
MVIEFEYYTASVEKECGRDVAVLEARAGSETRTLMNFGLCVGAATKSWRSAALDLGALRGQTVVLQFRSVLNSAKDTNSNLFLDNVRLCTRDQSAPAALSRCTAQ